MVADQIRLCLHVRLCGRECLCAYVRVCACANTRFSHMHVHNHSMTQNIYTSRWWPCLQDPKDLDLQKSKTTSKWLRKSLINFAIPLIWRSQGRIHTHSTHKRTHARKYTHTHTHTLTHRHTDTQTHRHTDTHVHIHTHTHTQTQTHTRTMPAKEQPHTPMD